MKRILVALALVGFAAPAFAQAADFASVDTDQNGAVSWEEVSAAMPDASEDSFKSADVDGSGDLSAEEYATVTGQ
ncbi:hypothetical protein [Hoeflea ulvae]|uniref:EF-hand domain-containing protein n=1 Tax=Hoeflea ulvae TaxID=2983764 RepID=A0ABT3YHR6_9HYPH|nr:hypothetical protein [Hoeflea ulvae]MCY0095440.1 hypothetical protein [Hoeflea ulvae]